ncbi:MAG: D-alanine--D-alanine ligase [Lentisphaerae bacterium]|nr:MAG: D-alanine--D-alanine ligase [Lentisphaerota bacterium]
MNLLSLTPEMPEISVMVLMGGSSSERDVSLISARGVCDALKRSGFKVTAYDIREPVLPSGIDNVDVVFPVLHGGFGEDGTLQALLESEKIPYVGCGPTASRLCMDKYACKQTLNNAELPVPFGMLIAESATTLDARLSLPFVMKPNFGGSSVGLHIIHSRDEFFSVYDQIQPEKDPVLLEEYIEGTEITVGLLDGKPLPPVEICPPGTTYDYDAKYLYKHGKTQYLCPPRSLDEATVHKAQDLAAIAWKVLDARDMIRIDMIVQKETAIPYILEANTIPGFTPTSLLPKAAEVAGISYDALCTHLVLCAWNRKQELT